MRKTLCFAVCLLLFSAAAVADEPAVPEWFKPDPKNPNSVYDAWRHLSSTEAALYLNPRSYSGRTGLYAGILLDGQGLPIGNCPLMAAFADGDWQGGAGFLRTDKDGYFFVDSLPFGLLDIGGREAMRNPRGTFFRAAPGYPFSDMGINFAATNSDLKLCRTTLVPASGASRFAVVICPRASKFDAEMFRKFVQRELAKSAEVDMRARSVRRFEPQTRADESDRTVRHDYAVRVVSPSGEAIPNAVLNYLTWGDSFRSLTVTTDRKGECVLVEKFLPWQTEGYYNRVRRWLDADIPGYAVGPVSPQLKKDTVNVITAKPGATVRCKLIDGNGNAIYSGISLKYSSDRGSQLGELAGNCTSDGSFAIDRIMPGEPFRLHRAGLDDCRSTPGPEVWTEEMTLKPGEIRAGVVVTVPQQAALRGIVVDEDDSPVVPSRFGYKNEFGEHRYGPDEGSNRLNMNGIASLPLRIKVMAAGFEPYVGPEISLKPGEMRFVKVVLKK
jgi:hypothetical protein